MKKFFLLITILFCINGVAQVTNLNTWYTNGNSISTNTAFIGTKTNRSILFRTNNEQRLKIDSLGGAILGGNTFTSATALTIKQSTANNNWIYIETDGTVSGANYVQPNNSIYAGRWMGTNSNHNLHFFVKGDLGGVPALSVITRTGTPCVAINATNSFTNQGLSNAGLLVVAGSASNIINATSTNETTSLFRVSTNGVTTTSVLNVASTMSVSSTATLASSNILGTVNGASTLTIHTGTSGYANGTRIMELPTAPGVQGFYFNQATPTLTNYALAGQTNATNLNSTNEVNIAIGNQTKIKATAGGAMIGTGLGAVTPLATLHVVGTMSVSSTSTLTGIQNNGNSVSTGSISSSSKTGGIGYAVGSGSTVTQGTSRTTGVTINAVTGQITLVSAAGSTSWQSFTVNNSAVSASDLIIVNQKSGFDSYMMHVTSVSAGSFRISFATMGGSTTEQPVFSFAVIKGQTN